jgi:protein-L-isoaspartate(D-aspartate) O-methyltransferase
MASRPYAGRLNEQLVTGLERSGVLRDPRVAAAFRAVPRHIFLPDHSLEEVYEDAAILTKFSEHGVAISSSSQPAIMAIMLQQLRPRPGHRVLEVGAGTGYNAALLARLVAPAGRVTTVEYDEDLCRQARSHLAAAGLELVEVVCGDGALGWPRDAPFNGIEVTASASDLAPAWLDQLVDGGRLVVPLWLAGPFQLSAGFVRWGRGFVSESLSWCGFMPLRGELAWPAAKRDLKPDLSEMLARPGRDYAADIPSSDARAGFEMWLALTDPGYVRLSPRPEEPSVFGLADEGGAALLEGDAGRLGVTVYGEAEETARRLLWAHSRWARTRPSIEDFVIEARPNEEPAEADARGLLIRRTNFTFRVTPRR